METEWQGCGRFASDSYIMKLSELPNSRLMTLTIKGLPEGVTCVVSMIAGTLTHETIMARVPAPEQIEVNPLDIVSRAAIVQRCLGYVWDTN